MKKLLLLISGIILISPLFSQDKSNHNGLTISAGGCMLIYQSVFSLQNSFGIEAAVRGKISDPLDWQAGMRLGLDPVLPEGFVRILSKQDMGVWQPEIGLELGITGRAYFEDGKNLLRETREAMTTDINALYMAVHTAPLAFQLGKGWGLSALEIDAGTHFSNFGRTLRLQLGIISASKSF